MKLLKRFFKAYWRAVFTPMTEEEKAEFQAFRF